MALVTTGLHGMSRNPMYVGGTFFQFGLGGVTRNGAKFRVACDRRLVPVNAATVVTA